MEELNLKVSNYNVDYKKLDKNELIKLNKDYTIKNINLLNYNQNLEIIIEDLQSQISNLKNNKEDPKKLVENMKFDNYKKFFNKLKKIIGEDINDIVEVGAHFGEDTLRFFYFFPECNVYSFEADPRNYKIMKKIIKNDKCHIYDYAVCDRDYETMKFYQSYNNVDNNFFKPEKYSFISYDDFLNLNLNGSGSSSLKKSNRKDLVDSNEIEVKTISLDSWSVDYNIKKIDLIWIDVQGAEREVILGSKKLLTKTKYVFIEYGETSYDGAMSRLQTIELFYNLNFKLIHDFSDNQINGDLLFEFAGDKLIHKFIVKENIYKNNEYVKTIKRYKYNPNEKIVKYIFDKLKINHGFFFEINSGDGKCEATRILFENSWDGLFTENDVNKFKELDNNYKKYNKKRLFYEKIKINSKEKYLNLLNKYEIDNIDFLNINSLNTQFLMYIDKVFPKIICIKGGQFMSPLDDYVNLKEEESILSQSLLYFNNIFRGKYEILVVTDCVYFIHYRYKKFFNYEKNLNKLYIDSLICNYFSLSEIIKRLNKKNRTNKIIDLLLKNTDRNLLINDPNDWINKNYEIIINHLNNIRLNIE